MDDITFDADTSGPVGESDSGVSEEVQESVEQEGLASPFLAKIPAQDRAVVARYIKDWDAGVTKKFQDYSSKLKPYQQYGTPEEVQRYHALYNNLRSNPQQVFKLMFEGFQQQYGDEFETMLPQILGLEEAMSEVNDQQYYAGSDDENDPDQVFQQNVMQELEDLRAWRDQQEQNAASAWEEQQLNTVLQGLHKQYGDFDDEGVLVRIAAHGDPHKAVKEWRATVAKYSQNGSQRQAPKVMGGQGGVPSEQVDAKSLRGADRRQAVQNALAALSDD